MEVAVALVDVLSTPGCAGRKLCCRGLAFFVGLLGFVWVFFNKTVETNVAAR